MLESVSTTKYPKDWITTKAPPFQLYVYIDFIARDRETETQKERIEKKGTQADQSTPIPHKHSNTHKQQFKLSSTLNRKKKKLNSNWLYAVYHEW